MIQATVQAQGFRITGHAELAPHGQDVLCAAVSMAGQFVVVGILQILELPAAVLRRPGELALNLEAQDPRATVLLATLRATLEQLARQYPDRLTITG